MRSLVIVTPDYGKTNLLDVSSLRLPGRKLFSGHKKLVHKFDKG